MDVIFYTFEKKYNSTKVPSSGGTTLSCVLKDNCSVIYPFLRLSVTDVPTYNYCYIESFGRYYYVGNWTYVQGLWECTLSIDVLGSYKTVIGNSTQYILRSTSANNGNVKDTMYPTTAITSQGYNAVHTNCTYGRGEASSQVAVSSFFDKGQSNGYYIVTVANNDGGPQTYELTYSNFEYLYNQLLEVFPTDFGELADGIVKALYKPIQYLQKAYWIPVQLPATTPTAQSSLKAGTLDIEGCFNSGALDQTEPIIIQYGFDAPKHPQSGTYGQYLDTDDYGSFDLRLYPFGHISLHPSDFVGYDTVLANLYVDIRTGQAELEVLPYDSSDSSTGSVVYHATGTYGVEIPVVQSTVEFGGLVGGAMDVISGGFNMAYGYDYGKNGLDMLYEGTHISAEDIGKSYMQAGAKDITQGAIGMVGNGAYATTVGSQGSALQFMGYLIPRLYYKWNYITAKNNDHKGTPVCAEMKIGDLSGFVLCEDGDVELTATQEEREIVRSFLVSGFYYE